ncbi:MAG: cysteine desulfurase [Coxiella sp. DG_40]|nr:MAG: cysteine desulfurase [Coxiella sp. DG_40]
MRLPIYLDYMATTPVDPRVKAKMDKYLTVDGDFGNPSSRSHIYGKKAKQAVEHARSQVAKLLNADTNEIIWTSCATEANNLAIKGVANLYFRKGKHIITCASEHKSVLEPCAYLESKGFKVTCLVPEKNGLLDLDNLKKAIRKDTILVSIMYVNNEIGVIQDINAIGNLVRPNGIVFHVDAVQAAGKLPLNVKSSPVDLMSFSAHKVYGPKGIGILYVRRKPRIHLEPLIHGGGQEFGMRSGTLPVHQIVGMGEAFAIAKKEMAKEQKQIRKLRDKLWNGINSLGNISINGDIEQRVTNNLNVCFKDIDGEKLITTLKNLAISTSSACVSAKAEPSYVLQAIGLSNKSALSSIRFSLGRFTTEDEIDYTIRYIQQVIPNLQK